MIRSQPTPHQASTARQDDPLSLACLRDRRILHALMSRSRPRLAALRLAAVIGTVVVLTSAPSTALVEAKVPARHTLDVEVTLPDTADDTTHSGHLTLSLRFDAVDRVPPDDDLVALIRGPHIPTRLLPLTREEATAPLSATVDLDVQDFVDLPPYQRHVPITCIIAQRKGQQLVTLASRTVSVDVPLAPPTSVTQSAETPAAAPQGTDKGPAASAATGGGHLTDAPEADPVGILDPPLEAIAVRPPRIKEQALVPEGPTSPSPAYWHALKLRIMQRVRPHQATPAAEHPLAAPTLHFRLFANGTTQSIRLDPTSGDPQVDEAVLKSVTAAQPFPPFPSGVTQPHVDVHLALPPLMAPIPEPAPTETGTPQQSAAPSSAPMPPAPPATPANQPR